MCFGWYMPSMTMVLLVDRSEPVAISPRLANTGVDDTGYLFSKSLMNPVCAIALLESDPFLTPTDMVVKSNFGVWNSVRPVVADCSSRLEAALSSAALANTVKPLAPRTTAPVVNILTDVTALRPMPK